MRYLHPVQAHERFLASGAYRFSKDGERLRKSEAWTAHGHPDGETFLRVDMDAREEEGKSILLEALQSALGEIVRFDVRYENANFEGGVKTLRATYQLMGGQLQVGFSMNGADRRYLELALPAGALMDIPLLIFRGRVIQALASAGEKELPIFAPMLEHAQLFPGILQTVKSPVEYAGVDAIEIGGRATPARRYRYRDKAAAYWIDGYGVVVKRVNAFKQSEFLVEIANYAVSPSRVAIASE